MIRQKSKSFSNFLFAFLKALLEPRQESKQATLSNGDQKSQSKTKNHSTQSLDKHQSNSEKVTSKASNSTSLSVHNLARHFLASPSRWDTNLSI